MTGAGSVRAVVIAATKPSGVKDEAVAYHWLLGGPASMKQRS
jgi:hypothetical protein